MSKSYKVLQKAEAERRGSNDSVAPDPVVTPHQHHDDLTFHRINPTRP
jgi:hypothetical protein